MLLGNWIVTTGLLTMFSALAGGAVLLVVGNDDGEVINRLNCRVKQADLMRLVGWEE